MKWIYLLSGLLFETTGFVALKYSQGLTRTVPIIFMVVADLLALLFFVLALRKFDPLIVYMIGAGLGTALIAISNYLVFKQNLNWIQIGSIILIIAGTVGLQSQGGTH